MNFQLPLGILHFFDKCFGIYDVFLIIIRNTTCNNKLHRNLIIDFKLVGSSFYLDLFYVNLIFGILKSLCLNGLAGNIQIEIRNLSALTYLALSHNGFSGM